MKALATLLILVASVGCMTIQQENCKGVLGSSDALDLIESNVWVHPQLPMNGYIEGFSINRLESAGGEIFRPRNIIEGVCALDLMLDAQTRRALRSGLKDYQTSQAITSDCERVERLESSINQRLDALYGDAGMFPGSGLFLIRTKMGDQFGFELWSSPENYGALQTLAGTLGVTSPFDVPDWMLVEYFEHLGVGGFESKDFLKYFKNESECLEDGF